MDNLAIIVAAIAVVLVFIISFVALKLASGKQAPIRLSEDLGAIKSIMENLQRMVPEIKGGVDLGVEAQRTLQQNLAQTAQAVERIRSAYEERKVLEDATRFSINITANSNMSDGADMNLRIDAVDGNNVIVLDQATGVIQDTTNSDAITNGQNLSFQYGRIDGAITCVSHSILYAV